MERYRPTPQPEGWTCPPPAVAVWYHEQVAPEKAPVPPYPTEGHQQPAIPIDPITEADPHPLEAHRITAAEILAKIRAPYAAQQKQLERLYKRLQPTVTTEAQSADESEVLNPVVPPPTYATAFGTFSFPELVERSRKYAAFVLYHTYQVAAADIEDGLQSGLSHLWQRLQQEPNRLQDKPMAWIGKGMVYQALHAIRHDWRYLKHTQSAEGRSSTDRRGTQSPESRQADLRIDLHQAIAEVAHHILTHEKGKQAQHDLWALYGLTMLHVSSSEVSRLFQVREQSMHAAYNRVREQLKAALPHYAPHGETKRVGQRGPEALPQQDMTAIRRANAGVSEAVYTAVQAHIERLDADTRPQDELALEGIQQAIPISTQARKYGLPQYQMQRAYKRVHLLLAAERDPTVRTLRPERRVKQVFTLTAESAAAVEQLALDLLQQPKSYEKLVALHAHIGNLAISTTAKYFNIPTSTLRYYSQQIGRQLQTPTQPARKEQPEQPKQNALPQPEVTVYVRDSAAD